MSASIPRKSIDGTAKSSERSRSLSLRFLVHTDISRHIVKNLELLSNGDHCRIQRTGAESCAHWLAENAARPLVREILHPQFAEYPFRCVSQTKIQVSIHCQSHGRTW